MTKDEKAKVRADFGEFVRKAGPTPAGLLCAADDFVRGIKFTARCEDIRAVCWRCEDGALSVHDGLPGNLVRRHEDGAACRASGIYARLLADGHSLEDVVRKVKEAK